MNAQQELAQAISQALEFASAPLLADQLASANAIIADLRAQLESAKERHDNLRSDYRDLHVQFQLLRDKPL